MSRSGIAGGQAGALWTALLLPLLLLAACGPGSPAAPPAPSNPGPSVPTPSSSTTPLPYGYPTPPPPPASSLSGLKMFNVSTGWAQRSLDQAVLHTTQGVQRWSVATPTLPPGQRIAATSYVSADSARVLAAGGVSSNPDAAAVTMTFNAWATDDGGAHWSRGGSFSLVQDPGLTLSWQDELDYVNAADGWFSGNVDGTDGSLGTTLFRTVDGGVSWKEMAHLPQSPAPPGGVPCYAEATATFASPTMGWLVGGCAKANFEVTRNGGATWSPHRIPRLTTPYLGLENPTFITSWDGVMLGTVPRPESLVVYATLDGGQKWTAHPAPGQWPHALDFINTDDGWLLSSNTMNAGFPAGLYVTHDGGQTWSTLQALDYGAIPAGGTVLNGSILDFVSPTLGWTNSFTGDGNVLLQTTDSGHTWSPVDVQITGSSG